MRRFLAEALTFVRWWLGMTYLVFGTFGVVIWAPWAFLHGDDAGSLLLMGAAVMTVAGWLIHPWGLQRGMQADALSRPPRSWMPAWMLRYRPSR
jgi:hypothetical protein